MSDRNSSSSTGNGGNNARAPGNTGTTTSRWAWLPGAMPNVARALAQARREHGAEWVSQCWKLGVIQGQSGYFFAAEGGLTVGTPTAAQVLTWFDPQPGERGVFMLALPAPVGQVERVAA